MDNENKYLLKLLREELNGKKVDVLPSGIDWEKLVNVAEKHAVLPFLYDSLAENAQVPEEVRKIVQTSADVTVQKSYRLIFLCKYFIKGLIDAKIPVLLLKGAGTASYYPVPELRKTGDIDLLLLDKEKLSEATELLVGMGCREKDVQLSLHHVSFETDEGVEIELHIMLAEPFDNNKINSYIDNLLSTCKDNSKVCNTMGINMPILREGYHAYELLLHMLQHFLRSGFGLKLLCDWVIFWNHKVDEEECVKYSKLVQESGVKGFSDMVTLFCCKYLGLNKDNVAWMNLPSNYKVDSFLEEIMEAEEFGKSSKDRMVILRGNKFTDYLREFHHQMKLNFPKSSRCYICWPILWTITLLRFARNNRKIRKISAYSILKKTGERSKMMEQIGLFQFNKNSVK